MSAALLSLLFLAAAVLAGARWSRRGGCMWIVLSVCLAAIGGVIGKVGGG